MIKLIDKPVVYKNGRLVWANAQNKGNYQGGMAYNVLLNHDTCKDGKKLKIKFDEITSHDITYVGIIQTAKASGLEKFPLPYN